MLTDYKSVTLTFSRKLYVKARDWREYKKRKSCPTDVIENSRTNALARASIHTGTRVHTHIHTVPTKHQVQPLALPKPLSCYREHKTKLDKGFKRKRRKVG